MLMRFTLILLSVALPLQALSEAKPAKIAALLPLTGDYAALGAEIQKGMELGLAEGNPGIQVVFEDIGTVDRNKAVNASLRLINVEGIDAALTVTASESVPVAPLFQAAKKPLIVLWDSNRSLLDAGSFIFSTGFSNEESAYLAASLTRERLGKSTVAVVENTDAYSTTLADAFVRRFIELGGKIVARETVSTNDSDFRSALVRIGERKPESIYFPLIASPSAFLRQARQMKIEVPFVTGETMLIPGELEAAGSAADGIYYTAAYTDDSSHLQDLCSARYGRPCADILSVSMGYCGIKLVKTAAASADRNGGTLQQSMLAILGPSRSANRKARIYRVQQGTVVEAH